MLRWGGTHRYRPCGISSAVVPSYSPLALASLTSFAYVESHFFTAGSKSAGILTLSTAAALNTAFLCFCRWLEL